LLGFNPCIAAYESHFHADINNSTKSAPLEFYVLSGIIHAFTNKDTFNGTFTTCLFTVSVPRGLFIEGHGQFVETESKPCVGSTLVLVHDKNDFTKNGDGSYVSSLTKAVFSCFDRYEIVFTQYLGELDDRTSRLVLAEGNTLYLLIEDPGSVPADFVFYFTSVSKNRLHDDFVVEYSSYSSGYITLPGFRAHLNYPIGLKFTRRIEPPPEHVLMLSSRQFQVFDGVIQLSSLYPLYRCLYDDVLKLNTVYNGTVNLFKRLCGDKGLDPTLFNSSMELSFESKIRNSKWIRPFSSGFELLFSFHPFKASVTQLPNGRFNCSRHYAAFRQHLECNVRLECEGGEDETEACPYTSHLCPPGSLFHQVTRYADKYEYSSY
jgi:hypothetical protein